jgi:hypothetical protein
MSELRDKFIDDLSEELDRLEVENAEDILADKISEYDSLIQKNMTDMEVIIKLGDPKDIVKNITSGSLSQEQKAKESLSSTVSELLKKPEPIKEKSLEEEFSDYTPIKSSKPAGKGKKDDKKQGKNAMKLTPSVVPKAVAPSSNPKPIQSKEPSTLSKAKTISSASYNEKPAEKTVENVEMKPKMMDRKPVFHLEPDKEIPKKTIIAPTAASKITIPKPVKESVIPVPEQKPSEKDENISTGMKEQEFQADNKEELKEKEEKEKKSKDNSKAKASKGKPVTHKIKKEKRKRRPITKLILFLFIFATGIVVPLGIFYGLLNMFLSTPRSERLITLGICVGASIVALIINHGFRTIAKKLAISNLKYRK